jgi:hypothetical protein
MSTPTIVTPRGWWDLADAASFYPEDLPEDWRLSFFANAFNAVLLPQQVWTEADQASWATWRDDVTPRFRFVAEVAAAATPQHDAAALQHALGEHLSHWIDTRAEPADGPSGADQLGVLRCRAAAQAGRTDDYALSVPGSRSTDLRAARHWLEGISDQRGGRAPAVVVLTHPTSDTLGAWQRLIELLGLARD